MIRAQTREHPILQPAATSEDARHDARDLTAGGSTARIVLDGKVYTLRITRAGKLILTK
jgi:hemin uptake protein HemP